MDGGGPDLRGKKGREGHVGDERGAAVVDERVDLLSLFAAGFHLKHTTEDVMEPHWSQSPLSTVLPVTLHTHTHTLTHTHLL